jgi:hypothetical protein
MIRTGRIFNVFVLLLFISGCMPILESNIPGVYVGQNYTNSIDTLIIMENGKYQQIVYRKEDKSLAHKHVGIWEYSEGCIDFDSLLVNRNEKFSKHVENWDNVLMSASLPAKRKGNLEINIIVDYDKNYYYKKIE